MRCDTTRTAVSAEIDGALADSERASLHDHLRSCASCAEFERSARRLHQQLRVQPVDATPDVASAVRVALARDGGARSRRSPRPAALGWLARPMAVGAAASLVMGMLIGAVLVADGAHDDGSVAAADVPARVVAAQAQLAAVRAEISIVEHGWHEQVPVRTFEGRLVYRAPEMVSLDLTDTTHYPNEAWKPNDVRLVVRDDLWWTSGVRSCPGSALPTCTPAAPRVEVVTRREPFSASYPVPLDLVVPVASFAGAAVPESLGTRVVDGHDAVGLRVTAAQVAPLLEGLRPAGNLREVHPTDPVELWLDEQTLVPLRITVRASDVPGRDRWATNRAYLDEPGALVLEVALRDVVTNGEVSAEVFADPPSPTSVRDAGFVDGVPERPAGLQVPTRPAHLDEHRAGQTDVSDGSSVREWSWSDGRAWLTLRAVTGWQGERLFGGDGAVVQRQMRAGSGVVFVDEQGGRVALHTPDLDVVLVGTVDLEAILQVVDSLGLVGVDLPPSWPEAAGTTIDDALATIASLRVPSAPEGFAAVSVTRSDLGAAPTFELRWSGPGDRAFSLAVAAGDRLGPPLDQDVTGLQVRGRTGRLSLERGEIEWVEEGVVYRIDSASLSMPELLAIVETMETP